MTRKTKYEDLCVDEEDKNIQFSTKLFMYINPKWDILFPYVEIIRLLPKNTIIAYKVGKNQNKIREYATGYFHRVIENTFINKQDYHRNIVMGRVKYIFTFNDTPDNFSENLIKLSDSYKIPLVCYSSIDKYYHCWKWNTSDKKEHIKYTTPEEVINFMKEVETEVLTDTFNHLFPELNLDTEPVQTNVVLKECVEVLRNKSEEIKKTAENNKIKLYDPHMAKLKKHEYNKQQEERAKEISQIDTMMSKIRLGDNVEVSKKILNGFFKKPVKK